MVKSSASRCFLKTFFRMASQNSPLNNQMTRLFPVPRPGSVPDRARVLPGDLRAVTATNAIAMEMTVPRLLFPWTLGLTEISLRGRYRSVPIPKRPSSWLICFCWCARDWNFWKWTGAAENWVLTRYHRLSFIELCGKSVLHHVGSVSARQNGRHFGSFFFSCNLALVASFLHSKFKRI